MAKKKDDGHESGHGVRPDKSSVALAFAKDLGLKVASDELGSDVANWYPTGCAPIDIIFGGGVPSGKIIECFGAESTGKSTLALECSKAFTNYWKQRDDDNYVLLWVESESALDKIRAEYMGCELDRFMISEAETVEDGFEIIAKALDKAQKNSIRLFIVWDTIAAIPTKNEREGATNNAGMMEKPRIIRQELRKITTPLGHTNSSLIFCNQVIKNPMPFAEDESPGGGGIKFHASIRCKLRKIGDLKEKDSLGSGKDVTRGLYSEVWTKKNKLTLPYQRCNISIVSERGLDQLDTTMQFLLSNKIIVMKDGGYKYLEFNDREYRFQNISQLRDLIEVTDPNIKVYMDYLCYNYYSKVSPLMKIKLLEKLWEQEVKLFGSKQTKVTNAEYDIAARLMKSLLEEQDLESNK